MFYVLPSGSLRAVPLFPALFSPQPTIPQCVTAWAGGFGTLALLSNQFQHSSSAVDSEPTHLFRFLTLHQTTDSEVLIFLSRTRVCVCVIGETQLLIRLTGSRMSAMCVVCQHKIRSPGPLQTESTKKGTNRTGQSGLEILHMFLPFCNSQ